MNLNKIKRKLNKRMTGYALQPTDDEVSIMWLVTEVDRLNELLKIGNSNETGEDSDAPLASLASLVSL